MSVTTQKIARVLDRLRDALGTGETPPNSNDNFIVKWYNTNVANIGRGPWCEMTATWAMWVGGARALKTGRAYTVWAVEDAIAKKLGSSWHSGTRGMRSGDQVYYDWSASGDWHKVDHTGIVEKINGDGTFYVLEGNTANDKLQRMLRDGKYVVGYTRYDWDRLPNPTPVPPIVRPRPDRPDIKQIQLTKRIQTTLEVPADGIWGSVTDARARRMQAAARAHAGYPRKIPAKFDIRDVQRVIDTNVDGVWGSLSYISLIKWVKEFQTALGVTPDGQWGPKTNNAFLAAQKRNRVV